MKRIPRRLIRHCLWFCSLTALLPLGSRPAAAQPAPGAPALTGKTGLSPADQRMAVEMTNRGMDKLLQYFLDKNHVSPADQQAIRFSSSWMELTTDAFSKLPYAKQQERIHFIVDAIGKNLASMHDPTQLMNQASALILKGEAPYVNTLEYWGENTRTQAALNPIAEAVDKILTQAGAEAADNASRLLGQIQSPTSPLIHDWELADGQTTLAQYTQALARYNLAISLDKINPRRKEVCDQAIETLKTFDAPEQTVQLFAEMGIAKLNLAKGDYAEANKYFDLIINNAAAPSSDQYNARYFRVVSDMMAKKFDGIDKELQALIVWQKTKLPADKAVQDGADATADLLAYRIADAQGQNEKAVATLMDLLVKQPNLKGAIFEQVLDKLPANPDMPKLNPLLLEALVTRGDQAARKGKPDEAPTAEDLKEIDRAIDAAKEIVSRAKAGLSSMTEAQARDAAFTIPVLLERTNKNAEAADRFMDFAAQYPQDKHADDAMHEGVHLAIDKLDKDPATRDLPENVKRSDRALEMAVAHGGVEYAYALGLRYKKLTQWKNAAETFAKVPASGDPTMAVMAKYFEMFADNELLGDANAKLNDYERIQTQKQIQTLADQINKSIPPLVTSAKNPEQKQSLESVSVLTTLTACDNARANKDYQRTIDLLAGIEDKLVGLKAEETYKADALYQRFVAQSALGQNAAAMETLNKLIGAKKGNPQEAVNMISNFLAKLEDEYLHARETKNNEALYSLGAQRAQLSALLIKQLENDPKNPNRTAYLKFNANAQRQAAELEKEPAKRKSYLDEAMSTYAQLLKDSPSDEGLKFEIALCEFDLAQVDPTHYAKAQAALEELVPKLGKPELPVTEVGTGTEKRVPNNNYWQGVYELLRSSVEVAKLDASKKDLRTESQDVLRKLLILYPDPPLYKEEFKKLRQELLPGWDPNIIPATHPAAAAVTPPKK